MCVKGAIQTKLDMLNFLKLQKPEYCGWMKVRYLPEGLSALKWHPTADKMQGTAFYGSNKNNLKAWSIRFLDLKYD